MATDPKTAAQPAPRGPAPVAPAVRSRLQKTFEHAQRCVEKDDFDYAHQLFTQCVAEDPANIIYLPAMLANLQKKYRNNKKGAKLAGLKIKSHRMALAKAASKGEWLAAFQAGCAALALNPWDIPTLLAMASACNELHIDECQLYYLRWALDVDPKDPAVNRQAAQALQRMGQFDQAIACWHRVEQARPQDEDARQGDLAAVGGEDHPSGRLRYRYAHRSPAKRAANRRRSHGSPRALFPMTQTRIPTRPPCRPKRDSKPPSPPIRRTLSPRSASRTCTCTSSGWRRPRKCSPARTRPPAAATCRCASGWRIYNFARPPGK